jgi:hypothetical protein
MAAISRRIEHRDARADQRLRDARIVLDPRSRRLARADQDQPEQSRADHPQAGRHQPDLDRIAHQIDGGGDECDAAQPDQQPPADQPLEQAAKRLGLGRSWSGRVLFPFPGEGRGPGLASRPVRSRLGRILSRRRKRGLDPGLRRRTDKRFLHVRIGNGIRDRLFDGRRGHRLRSRQPPLQRIEPQLQAPVRDPKAEQAAHQQENQKLHDAGA